MVRVGGQRSRMAAFEGYTAAFAFWSENFFLFVLIEEG